MTLVNNVNNKVRNKVKYSSNKVVKYEFYLMNLFRTCEITLRGKILFLFIRNVQD